MNERCINNLFHELQHSSLTPSATTSRGRLFKIPNENFSITNLVSEYVRISCCR